MMTNKFVNQHKLEVGLYLMASGATWDAIDTMSRLGYSTCAKTVESFRKRIYNEYVKKTEEHFIKNVNFNKLFFKFCNLILKLFVFVRKTVFIYTI